MPALVKKQPEVKSSEKNIIEETSNLNFFMLLFKMMLKVFGFRLLFRSNKVQPYKIIILIFDDFVSRKIKLLMVVND